MKYALLGVVLVVLCLTTGCTMTSMATNYSGLTTPDGNATHVNTTNVAVNLLFTKPIWGDATLQQTVLDCTREAKSTGAGKIRLVQSDSTTYWWLLPPISFIVQPVVTNVAGDALK